VTVSPLSSSPKIIVLDDDPTGSQTVHSCLLLTRWDVDTLLLGLEDAAPIFFVLTNTRALSPIEAAAITRDACQNLKLALARSSVTEFLVVSRSDSTLRGHYPIETDVIAEELGPFDAHFLTPAFFEGGRITRDSIHYLIVNGQPTPVDQTEFARDSVFGYSTAYLPDYVAEKTKGRIAADQVERVLLADLRATGPALTDRLLALTNNHCVSVDGEVQADLDRFAAAVLVAAGQGKRFLFRSAASLLTALAQLPPQPIAPAEMARYVRGNRPGVVIVGSHVQKTTEQLGQLLADPGIAPIEVPVAQLVDGDEGTRDRLLAGILDQIHQGYEQQLVPVVYTSRGELQFPDSQTRLDFGVRVSTFLMAIVQRLPEDIGFLISKGGITSNDTLSLGLGLRTARLLGQILPGVSAVRTDADHPRYPNLPVVLFPGNVGDAKALATAVSRLRTY
jgi:uncharacterized protein YgbK (DUF1537 family)